MILPNLRVVPGLAFGFSLMSGEDYCEQGEDEYNLQALTIYIGCFHIDFFWEAKREDLK